MDIRDFIDENTSFLARDGFVARKIAGETILVPVGANAQEFNGMVKLNETSEVVWNALARPKSFKELIAILYDNFNIPEGVDIEEDIMQFLIIGIKNQLIFILKPKAE